MKIFVVISLSMLPILGTLLSATPKEAHHAVTSYTQENIFVLKASRRYKGAEVEVLSSTGYLVTSRKLTKRKLIIDFKNVQTGSYLIRVKKGGMIEEFQFNKRSRMLWEPSNHLFEWLSIWFSSSGYNYNYLAVLKSEIKNNPMNVNRPLMINISIPILYPLNHSIEWLLST